jgi:hypothetical protein
MSNNAPKAANEAQAQAFVGRKAKLRCGIKVTLKRLDTRPADVGFGFYTYPTGLKGPSAEAYIHQGDNDCPSPYDVIHVYE